MLIECPECSSMVSDKAAACPKCGVAIAGQVTPPTTSPANQAAPGHEIPNPEPQDSWTKEEGSTSARKKRLVKKFTTALMIGALIFIAGPTLYRWCDVQQYEEAHGERLTVFQFSIFLGIVGFVIWLVAPWIRRRKGNQNG